MTPDLAFLLAYEAPRHDRLAPPTERELCDRSGALGPPSRGLRRRLAQALRWWPGLAGVRT